MSRSQIIFFLLLGTLLTVPLCTAAQKEIDWNAVPKDTTEISLRRYRLKSVPEELCHYKNLVSLNLSKNKIAELPKCIGELPLLELNLSGNEFKQFPKEIQELTQLQHLDLGMNALDSIPKWIASHQELLSLKLYDNNLNRFPKNLATAPKLREVDLGLMMYNREEMDMIRRQFPQLHITFGVPCNCPSTSVEFY